MVLRASPAFRGEQNPHLQSREEKRAEPSNSTHSSYLEGKIVLTVGEVEESRNGHVPVPDGELTVSFEANGVGLASARRERQ